MSGGEGDVALGVPVLREDDVLEVPGELIDDRHDLVAVCDRKRATGTEVVLHIDNDERVVSGDIEEHQLLHTTYPDARCSGGHDFDLCSKAALVP